jgi:hypothetical protein
MSYLQPTTVSSLKKFMQDLREAGYKDTLVFHYYGSGDSGEVEPCVIDRTMQGTLDALGWRMDYCGQGYTYEYGRMVAQGDDHDKCLLTLVSELLPGGWEINEGSSGEVALDINDVKIIVRHNQNVMTTEYSEETF